MIKVNIDKAKEFCHEKRRAKRTEEFKPLDVKATIPSEAVGAEAARQVVRDKYDQIQKEIDAARNPEELKSVLERM